MKTLSVALALVGLALATALVAWFGVGAIWHAAQAIGWHGFALLMIVHGLLFMVLGASWAVIAPYRALRHPVLGRFSVYVWGRMVRDSAGNCLPFTHMAGFVAGARAVSLHGVPAMQATASTIADVTAEVLAQAIFVGFGLVVVLLHAPGTEFIWPIAIGLAVALPVLATFMAMQQGAGRIFARLSGRIAGGWFTNAKERGAVLAAEFSLIYGHTTRLALCVGIHLLGWLGTGAAGWVTFRLLGAEISLIDAIAVEAMLHAVMAAAFLVPGHAGVQEATYIGLGALFGIPPEVALAASLLRRARDLGWGIPVLLIWQGLELRRLRRA